MNGVDIFLAVIIIASLVGGVRRGFIFGVLDLVRWFGSLLLALGLYRYIDAGLAVFFDWSDSWRAPAAFLISIVISVGIMGYLEWIFLQRVPREAHSNPVNRGLGFLPGGLRGIIFAAILSTLMLALPLPESIGEHARGSSLANFLAAQTDRVESALAPDLADDINTTLTRMLVRPESEKFVDLPFTVKSPKLRPDLEAQMLKLLNEERETEGLAPLVADTALRGVARGHSVDMFARGYFSHITPDSLDPFDRIRAGKIRFRTAGENLALAQTVRIAHDGLMNSPGHRANILRPQFGRVGIGILDGGRRGLMVTQNFRN